MFCGLEKIEDNKYKCWKYTLLGKGVEKKDRDKYVIIDEKEAKSIRRIIIAFYVLGSLFCIEMGRSWSDTDPIWWGMFIVFNIILFPKFLGKRYNILFGKINTEVK